MKHNCVFLNFCFLSGFDFIYEFVFSLKMGSLWRDFHLWGGVIYVRFFIILSTTVSKNSYWDYMHFFHLCFVYVCWDTLVLLFLEKVLLICILKKKSNFNFFCFKRFPLVRFKNEEYGRSSSFVLFCFFSGLNWWNFISKVRTHLRQIKHWDWNFF